MIEIKCTEAQKKTLDPSMARAGGLLMALGAEVVHLRS